MQEYKFLGGSTEFDGPNVSVADKFRRFIQEAKDHNGKLYATLSEHIIEDEEMLRVAEWTKHSPIPNMFFAAVHFLLMNDRNDPLARFYSSISVPAYEDVGNAFEPFKDFVLRNEYRLIEILKTGITQTNEVGRCAYLLPAFQTVFELGKRKPLSLIDVGCSAGLHLLWDKYHYEYKGSDSGFIVDGDRSVKIFCEVRGSLYPPVPFQLPHCMFRVGIDLDPIELTINQQRRWLASFVFPDLEHTLRRQQLKSAIFLALQNPPPVVKGDVIKVLPDIFPTVPEESTLCIYHSHSMYQSNQKLWDQFEGMMVSMSNIRDIYWVIAEGYELHLRILHNGKIHSEKLANKAAHGQWLEWVKEAV